MSESTALTTTAQRAGGTLAVYDKISDLVAYCNEMAESTAAMIPGCDLRAGKAVALLLARRGWDALDFIENFHMIQGRPVKKSDAILKSFALRGGSHQLLESTPERARLRLIDKDGNVTEWETTWEQALQENWPWAKGAGPGSEPTRKNLKDNWATPLGRENMLWWRTVSRACHRVDPGSISGISLEETDYIIDAPYTVISNGQPPLAANGQSSRPTAAEILARQAASAAAQAIGDVTDDRAASGGGPDSSAGAAAASDDAIDAEFERADAAAVNVDAAQAATAERTTQPAITPGTIRRDQFAEIEKLAAELWGEPWKAGIAKALERRGCRELVELSREQAKELIGNLRLKLQERQRLAEPSKN